MKISPLVVLLAGAAIGGLAWGSCQAGRASDAEIRLAAALHEDSAKAAQWEAERGTLLVQLDSLKADSAMLAQRYAALRRFVPSAQDSIRRLLALLPDSSRLSLEPAIAVLQESAETCHFALANCEARAANAEQRAAGDSLRVTSLQLLTDSLEAAWRSAERRARPSFFRDLWRARSVTLPLLALSAFLLVTPR